MTNNISSEKITVTESYDEEGRLILKETVVETEFWAPEQVQVGDQPQWLLPYITNTSNNSHRHLSDGVE